MLYRLRPMGECDNTESGVEIHHEKWVVFEGRDLYLEREHFDQYGDVRVYKKNCCSCSYKGMTPGTFWISSEWLIPSLSYVGVFNAL